MNPQQIKRIHKKYNNTFEREKLTNSIACFRHVYDMTQEELAKKIGLSRQSICSIEEGKSAPNLMVALKIAKTLQCKIDDIFELQNWRTY